MSFEEFKEEIKKREITITQEEFTRKISEVMCKEPVNEVITRNPVLMLSFSMFGAELCRELFSGKKDENKESEEE